MNFAGFTPYAYERFGGCCDAEDVEVLPVGVAAVCKNCRFLLTSVATRFGLQTTMQSPNQAPISGLASLIYTPENPGETLFQVPMAFDTDGFLLIEQPVGSGILVRVQGPLVTQPTNAYAIITEAYNRALIAYSNLKIASGPANVYSLNALSIDALGNTIPGTGAAYLDPYGQKPLGAAWLASTTYLVGEYVQPTVAGGNGHLYRCTQGGTTAAIEPEWPLVENGAVMNGSCIWEEITPWLANRLPAPSLPNIGREAGAGTFAAGRDVYIIVTYANPQGESLPSNPAILVDTAANDAVQVAIPTLASLYGPIRGLTPAYRPTGINVYEADVVTGGPAPAAASYGLYGSYGLGAPATVTHTATGAAPPTANTARITPGGLAPPPTPTVERASEAGIFAPGRDVYVIATFVNSIGETLPSVAGVMIDTVLDDAVQVPIPSTLYEITGVNLYGCDVATGSPAPAASYYGFVGRYQPLATATITGPSVGSPPPTVNTAGTAGNIAPDSTDDNDSGQVGYRYASIAFTNRNGNLSGTVPAFTSIFVDLPGYELYMANIPIGPSNVINRTIGFTVADGTNDGPFFYIPSTTVSAGVTMTSTVIYDNVTTTAFFNFTDEFLQAETSTDMTDRLRCILPPQAVDVYYSPSTDRIVLSGVDGYGSGHYISLAADAESYYGDTSPIQVANGNGQLCVCAREFQGALYSLKERSGFTIGPLPTDPGSWDVQQRWEGVGPVGPLAVCVTNKFLFFVHRSGAYAVTAETSEPERMTDELPDFPQSFWSTVNWDVQQVVWCSADEETKELRIGLPVNGAVVPNICLTLNYSEGLQGPIKFTAMDGTEKYVPGGRKWSFDDIQGNVAVKVERKLPTNASPFGIMRQSQVLIGSSSPDGTVQMIQAGVYNDNGQGIDCQYETACFPDNLSIVMLGGVAVNALGAGAMTVSVMVGRSFVVSPDGGESNEITLPNMPLDPEKSTAYGAGARGQNEKMRLRFTNAKVADSWFSLKAASLFTRPLFSARSGSGK